MLDIIGVISQKGGVAKSTVARLVACTYAAANYDVLLADMDTGQATSTTWYNRRLENEIKPELTVFQSSTVSRVLKRSENYDVIVLTVHPRANLSTLNICKASDIVIMPTGLSLDDLHPNILLANELQSKGIPADKINICFCRVGTSLSELAEATDYINQTPYNLLPGILYERTGYRRAADLGHAPNETPYPTLNDKADELAAAIYKRLEALTK